MKSLYKSYCEVDTKMKSTIKKFDLDKMINLTKNESFDDKSFELNSLCKGFLYARSTISTEDSSLDLVCDF